MSEREIIGSVVTLLEMGVIQEFQIEENLKLKGLPTFEINKLVPKIKATYKKMHPCY